MNKYNKIENYTISLSIFFSALFVTLLVVAQLPQWWKWIIFENTPMTWLQSIILFSSSLIAGFCFILKYLKSEKSSIIWILISSGFLYLCFDERFAIHERLREGFLKPLGIKIPIFFWTDVGDFILLLYLVIGLILLVKIIKIFKENKKALILFVLAVIFSSVAILMDSINIANYNIDFQRWEQFIEEILELSGMLMFTNSFFVMFMGYLKNIKELE